MPDPKITCESTLTDRYQTTVPDVVRKALHLHKRDKICYAIQPDGQVTVTRSEKDEEDPDLSQFLTLLAKDIGRHPQRVKAIDTGLFDRIQSLVSDVEIDLDAPLSEEDD